MNDKLDVFEILGKKNIETQNKGQEQETVSDPDFNDAIKQLSSRYSSAAPARSAARQAARQTSAQPQAKIQPAARQASAQSQTKAQPADRPQVGTRQPATPQPAKSASPSQLVRSVASTRQPAAAQPAKPVVSAQSAAQPTRTAAETSTIARKNTTSTDLTAISRRFGLKKLRTGKGKTEPKKKWTLVKILLSIAVLLLFFTFVINVPKVVGSSMEPALENGDRVVINLLARNYEAGDIIVFKTSSGEKLVKRIVAVDGDVINITPDKKFYINGKEPDEEYIFTETGITDIAVAYPVIVGEDSYFVLGDNRTNSKDSRNADVGLVDKEDIIGKVVFCIRKY